MAASHEALNNLALPRYEKAAHLFLSIRSKRTYTCYQKMIDLYVKKGEINKAIQHWFVYGYKIQTKFRDMEKSAEFYDKGDELRQQHDLPHTCVITTYEPKKYMDLNDALDERSRV
ncbi:hypothetical protein RF11_03223 [Thelohanellus kitauei]|uniref:Uncharacterized protein n=1 Tax=Thelohanellus kitauei TaxID=669202 RepID=A0A0C2J514_THEKT|nr:hypothetical protein RF11_03223 [Thelohanellus kitauei]